MDKIFINLKNCHGIKHFKHEFNFEREGVKNTNISLIYAPNGMMKTSFAKTLRDIGDGKSPQNKITNERPIHNIKIYEDDNSFEIDSEEVKERIFVIESMNRDFSFENTTPLISNKQSRDEYNEIFNDLISKKNEFLSIIKSKTKISVPRNENQYDFIENKINDDLNNDSESFLEFLSSFSQELDNDVFPLDINSIKYNDLFDDAILKLLKEEEIQNNIESFSNNLNNLLSKSKIYDAEHFNHNHAKDLVKSIKKNNLFEVGHQINFKGVRKNVSNYKELNKLLDKQMDKIFKDPSLKDDFENINKKFSNTKTKNFQNILVEHVEIMPYLDDIDNFKRLYWISVFNSQKEEYLTIINEYNEKRPELDRIRLDALNEQTEWQKIIEIFNKRFHVPFTLKLENKEDVILKEDTPQISFYYEDEDISKEISLDTIKEISSAGQERAMYLLDMLYQIEAKKSDKDTLLVFDDIADSFDYDNKYAIIEYIYELSKRDPFKIILLTHNFDFFRALKSRLNCKYTYFAGKNEYGIINLRDNNFESSNNIFVEIKKRIEQNPEEHIRDILALIPFIRNLYEYNGNRENFLKLTKILHYDFDCDEMTLNSLNSIYSEWNITLPEETEGIYNLIFQEAKEIRQIQTTEINIVNKLVLSMAIRLKAEKFMIDYLNIDDLSEFDKNQTRMLFEQFKDNTDENNDIEILERVAIMTPENIHVNSFMFEPLLDMSDAALKDLYSDVLSLINSQ